MLFETFLARISSTNIGEDLEIKQLTTSNLRNPQMKKAKSILDESASETILGQAMDVIFKEMDRYSDMLDSFPGINWQTYVNRQNASKTAYDVIPADVIFTKDSTGDNITVESETIIENKNYNWNASICKHEPI
jgi:hypothetical protein